MKRTNKKAKEKRHFKKIDIILTCLSIASMGLTIWAINIYRLTIIDFKYLIAISLLGTIISFAIIRFSKYKKIDSVLSTLCISLAIGGGLFYFGFLYLNQFFANKESLTEEYKIIKTGNFASRKGNCSQPYVIIDFNGSSKQLVFYCEYEKTIRNYSKVAVTSSKGLFGFDVIRLKQLIE